MSNDNDAALRSPQRRPLGRGLSALLGETNQPVSAQGEGGGAETAPTPGGGRSIQLIEIVRIAPHPDQPRRHFDAAALDELAESIAARGVIQPIVVRPAGNDHYQIVAGERRWRAAQKAQLHRIPAIIRDFSEAETLEIALVENIQREDLNPIEEAQAYRRLIDQFGHNQEALARLVGKSRSHVANLMRLLDLPDDVQDLVMTGALSMGHGRALIGAPGCAALAQEIAGKGLSVRETEKLVKRAREGSRAVPSPGGSGLGRDPDLVAMEEHLADLLGIKVGITFEKVPGAGGGKGTLTLHYSSLDQLDMICQRLTGGGI
jgi:ParB family chromosome partitioning protein